MKGLVVRNTDLKSIGDYSYDYFNNYTKFLKITCLLIGKILRKVTFSVIMTGIFQLIQKTITLEWKHLSTSNKNHIA